MRGRLGESRYILKRETTIEPRELEAMLSNLDDSGYKSLLVCGFYTGLRIAEMIGDPPRKWKVLSKEGNRLNKIGELPGRPGERLWMRDPKLWEWRVGEEHLGIRREDIKTQIGTAYITAKSLKHGKRKRPLELPLSLPYMNLVMETLWATNPKERLWPYTENQVWRRFKRASDGLVYPHSLRFSRATNMAKSPGIALKDMLGWFGWARASTADSYLGGEQSIAKAKASIVNSMAAKEVEE